MHIYILSVGSTYGTGFRRARESIQMLNNVNMEAVKINYICLPSSKARHISCFCDNDKEWQDSDHLSPSVATHIHTDPYMGLLGDGRTSLDCSRGRRVDGVSANSMHWWSNWIFRGHPRCVLDWHWYLWCLLALRAVELEGKEITL